MRILTLLIAVIFVSCSNYEDNRVAVLNKDGFEIPTDFTNIIDKKLVLIKNILEKTKHIKDSVGVECHQEICHLLKPYYKDSTIINISSYILIDINNKSESIGCYPLSQLHYNKTIIKQGINFHYAYVKVNYQDKPIRVMVSYMSIEPKMVNNTLYEYQVNLRPADEGELVQFWYRFLIPSDIGNSLKKERDRIRESIRPK